MFVLNHLEEILDLMTESGEMDCIKKSDFVVVVVYIKNSLTDHVRRNLLQSCNNLLMAARLCRQWLNALCTKC